MQPRRIHALVLWLGACFCLATERAAALEKPNIVLIVASPETGVNDLGCYSGTDKRTPHIDRLALEGKRFTRALAAQPLTAPSLAAILTGQNPARLSFTGPIPPRPDQPGQRLLQPPPLAGLASDCPTLSTHLRELGYATGFVGRWELGTAEPFRPEARGFQFAALSNPGNAAPKTVSARSQEEQAEKAEAFLEKNAGWPFLLVAALHEEDLPILVTSQPGVFSPSASAVLQGLDRAVGRILDKIELLGLREKTLVIFCTPTGGLHVCTGLGTPASANTPFRAGKGFLYEGGLRCPLLVRWPAKIAPGVVTEAVSLGDITPTLMESVGAEQAAVYNTFSPNALAASAPSVLDYQSLLPLLLAKSGSNAPASNSLPNSAPNAVPNAVPKLRTYYWHMPHYSNEGARPSGAIREGEWKLVEQYEDGRLELYRVGSDEAEREDASPLEPAKVAELRGKLEAWRRGINAAMPRPNAAFEPLRWQACYGAVDVTRMETRSSASEVAFGLAGWRAAMNAKGPPATGAPSPSGFVQLEARSSDVHGEKLRYESSPQTDALVGWVDAEDWVEWECVVPRAGRYAVEVLQGCAKGSSVVEVQAGQSSLRFSVQETGHPQRFIPRRVGELELPSGKMRLSIRALEKRGPTVMELRRIHLVRIP